MRYEPITPEILKKLQAAVGPKNVATDPDKMQPYSHDEVTDPAYHHMPEAVVFAETAEQVAAVVQLANDYHFPVVPRGAGTGLACGAVPIYGGVVLSLEKMNRILEINEDALYAVVEPGVRTSDLQDAAEAKGLFYAGDPCSGDSCFIGGNIADEQKNFTHFLLIKKGRRSLPARSKLIYFAATCPHEPGALLKMLQILAVYDLNMTKIESRPIKNSPGEYNFFIEFSGDVANKNVQAALARLAEYSKNFKLLGCY